jgi:hypothetical protein
MGFHYPEETWIHCIQSLAKYYNGTKQLLLSVSYYNNTENMQREIAKDSLS